MSFNLLPGATFGIAMDGPSGSARRRLYTTVPEVRPVSSDRLWHWGHRGSAFQVRPVVNQYTAILSR